MTLLLNDYIIRTNVYKRGADMDGMLIAVLFLLVLCIALLVYLIVTSNKRKDGASNDEIKKSIESSNSLLRQEFSSVTQNTVINLGEVLSENIKSSDLHQQHKLSQMEERIKTLSLENEQKLENIRLSVEKRLMYIQQDNNTQLEKMRDTVDEKLQKTLEDKMSRSFALVNERLEQVYKGLGEMQSLANGVGDLKRVLSNVKTRGVLGEIQLSAILKEILSPGQYEENAVTKKGSKCYVEFAVKLPGDDGGFIYLPIDSKFPGDTYAAVLNAYESGDKKQIEEAEKSLAATLKQEAKDIRDKYIDPPNTTDFAIMFLPFEGLYAQAVNGGMVELLQREYKVNIAGPSTMAALLNSLQMGFKTLTVQKRSAQVFTLLGEIKTEFDKFSSVLSLTQQRLDQANKELDRLVGVRTRQIQKKLSDMSDYAPDKDLSLPE